MTATGKTVRMTRRRLVGGTLLAPALVACAGGRRGGEDGASVGQVAPATVQLWHADDNAAAEGKVVAAWLPTFNAQYPQIKVEYQPRPNGWQDKLTAALVAGTPPDVVAAFGPTLRSYQQDGMLLPLEKYLKAAKFDGGDFMPHMYKGGQWNGHQFAIPQFINYSIMVYNRTHFKRAGIPFPTEAWTQDQMVDYARRLSSGTLPNRDVWGLSLLDWQNTARLMPLIWPRCGDINDPNDYSRFTFAKKENPEAFQWVHDLRWKERIASGTNAERGGVAARTAMYSTGAQAMLADSTAAIAAFKDTSQTDWAIAPMPKGPCGRGEWSGINGYVMPVGGKAPDASWRVLSGMTSKEVNKLRAELMWWCPARKSQFGIYAKLLPERNTQYAIPTDAIRPEPSHMWPKAAPVTAAVKSILKKLYDDNAISVPDALQQMSDAVAGILGPSAIKT
ncbi:MAG: sugar ABC transporter substrate-binding protein [Chloroflexi bacterium]|nr:sugar ABC transporter substrate-binding protein [Chloroflexota bacterium]